MLTGLLQIMKCSICHKSPIEDNVALFRVNKFGIKGIWRCKSHLTKKQKSSINLEVKNIIDIIEKSNMLKKE